MTSARTASTFVLAIALGNLAGPVAADVRPLTEAQFDEFAARVARNLRATLKNDGYNLPADIALPEVLVQSGVDAGPPTEIVSFASTFTNGLNDRMAGQVRLQGPDPKAGRLRSSIMFGPEPDNATKRRIDFIVHDNMTGGEVLRETVTYTAAAAQGRKPDDSAGSARVEIMPKPREGAPVRPAAAPRPANSGVRSDSSEPPSVNSRSASAAPPTLEAPPARRPTGPGPAGARAVAPQSKRSESNGSVVRRTYEPPRQNDDPGAGRNRPDQDDRTGGNGRREFDQQGGNGRASTNQREIEPRSEPGSEQDNGAETSTRDRDQVPRDRAPTSRREKIQIDLPERGLGDFLASQLVHYRDRVVQTFSGRIIFLDNKSWERFKLVGNRAMPTRNDRLRIELDVVSRNTPRDAKLRFVFLDSDGRQVEATPVLPYRFIPDYATTVAITSRTPEAAAYLCLFEYD